MAASAWPVSVRFRRRAPVGRVPGWPLCARERQSNAGRLDCWLPACRAANASLVPRLGYGGSGYPVRRDGVEVSAVGGDVLVGVLLEKSCLKRAGFGSSDASSSLAPAPRRPLLVHLNSVVAALGRARVPGEAGARALAGTTKRSAVASRCIRRLELGTKAGSSWGRRRARTPPLRLRRAEGQSDRADHSSRRDHRCRPHGPGSMPGGSHRPSCGAIGGATRLRSGKESTVRSRHWRRRWMVERPNVPGWDRSLRAVTEFAVAAAPGLTSGASPELTHEYLLPGGCLCRARDRVRAGCGGRSGAGVQVVSWW